MLVYSIYFSGYLHVYRGRLTKLLINQQFSAFFFFSFVVPPTYHEIQLSL